jgi:hypothetical protein
MKIEIAKDDLQEIRDIVWEGRAYYGKRAMKEKSVAHNKKSKAGTKLLKRINQALKKVHGHDCSGEHYVGLS